VRQFLPAFAALAFAAVVATPLPAQIAVSSQGGGLSSSMPSFGLPQMLPKMNMAGPLSSPLSTGGTTNPFGGTKTFSFAKMMPSFSWMKQGFFPIRTPTPQVPASALGQFGATKK
jgi:hypothetical protein